LLDQELTATAFKAHPYRHPTIGWLSDLQTMTRDDLYGYYRRFYVPNNATLVIVGDVETKDALRKAAEHFGRIPAGELSRRTHTMEPEQLGERRVIVEREGTTAYLKLGYHAPALRDADFFPMLILDAVLTGAKGVNLWASFRTPPPQRSARLYRALVNTGLASSVSAGLVPTKDPFLYTVSLTATEGVELGRLEEATLAEIERVRTTGVTESELQKAKRQLRARLVFENDSISNVAHQLGFFETIDSWRVCSDLGARIDAVTLEEVGATAAARLKSSRRTVGWYQPLAEGEGDEATVGHGASAGPAR
jgi:zinc protease